MAFCLVDLESLGTHEEQSALISTKLQKAFKHYTSCSTKFISSARDTTLFPWHPLLAVGVVCPGKLLPAFQPRLQGTNTLVKVQLWGAGANSVAMETTGLSLKELFSSWPVMCPAPVAHWGFGPPVPLPGC